MNGRAASVVALDHKASTDGSNPIVEAAETGTPRQVSPAYTIVRNIDRGKPRAAVKRDAHPPPFRMLDSVGDRLGHDEVQRRFERLS